eukprot:TRINITY_DN4920_c0_g1_i6.p2 TRINITY_DN4920_c0_g1~~TRINITY_DN4920_c0_g1_i6.p2  ORF type:complete len:195 (+),score=-4.97 TRINITY_DN4920_c0_g1_i6:50-634(+)
MPCVFIPLCCKSGDTYICVYVGIDADTTYIESQQIIKNSINVNQDYKVVDTMLLQTVAFQNFIRIPCYYLTDDIKNLYGLRNSRIFGSTSIGQIRIVIILLLSQLQIEMFIVSMSIYILLSIYLVDLTLNNVFKLLTYRFAFSPKILSTQVAIQIFNQNETLYALLRNQHLHFQVLSQRDIVQILQMQLGKVQI